MGEAERVGGAEGGGGGAEGVQDEGRGAAGAGEGEEGEGDGGEGGGRGGIRRRGLEGRQRRRDGRRALAVDVDVTLREGEGGRGVREVGRRPAHALDAVVADVDDLAGEDALAGGADVRCAGGGRL